MKGFSASICAEYSSIPPRLLSLSDQSGANIFKLKNKQIIDSSSSLTLDIVGGGQTICDQGGGEMWESALG